MGKGIYRLIVLVPHRDSLIPFDKYRARLFAAGFPGAFSFPMAAPLASVSRSFSMDELKELGRNIRLLTVENDGKINCTGSAGIKLSIKKKPQSNTEEERRPLTEATPTCWREHQDEKEQNLSFFGPLLTLTIEESLFSPSARAKIIDILSPPVLCAALVCPNEIPPSDEGPALSFRAASIANLAIRPLESGAAGYSFEWRIGPLIWLPKYKGGQGNAAC